MSVLSPASVGPTLPRSPDRALRQIGWLGHSGVVYGYDEEPREAGGFSPLYIQIGTWEDLGDGRYAVQD